MQMPTFCSKYTHTKVYTLVIFCINVKIFSHRRVKPFKGCYYLNGILQLSTARIDCDVCTFVV